MSRTRISDQLAITTAPTSPAAGSIHTQPKYRASTRPTITITDSYARRHVHDARFSFGAGKLEDLAGFTSPIIRGMIALFIAYETALQLMAPLPIHFGEAIPLARRGLLANSGSVHLLGGELRQLINLLLEMSLAGPRPIVSVEVPRVGENIVSFYEARRRITGLCQASGRNSTSYTRRVELDSLYVRNWSLWRDLGIFARTISAVLTGRGAN